MKHKKFGLLRATNEIAQEILTKNLGISENEELNEIGFLLIESLGKRRKMTWSISRSTSSDLRRSKLVGGSTILIQGL